MQNKKEHRMESYHVDEACLLRLKLLVSLRLKYKGDLDSRSGPGRISV